MKKEALIGKIIEYSPLLCPILYRRVIRDDLWDVDLLSQEGNLVLQDIWRDLRTDKPTTDVNIEPSVSREITDTLQEDKISRRTAECSSTESILSTTNLPLQCPDQIETK